MLGKLFGNPLQQHQLYNSLVMIDALQVFQGSLVKWDGNKLWSESPKPGTDEASGQIATTGMETSSNNTSIWNILGVLISPEINLQFGSQWKANELPQSEDGVLAKLNKTSGFRSYNAGVSTSKYYENPDPITQSITIRCWGDERYDHLIDGSAGNINVDWIKDIPKGSKLTKPLLALYYLASSQAAPRSFSNWENFTGKIGAAATNAAEMIGGILAGESNIIDIARQGDLLTMNPGNLIFRMKVGNYYHGYFICDKVNAKLSKQLSVYGGPEYIDFDLSLSSFMSPDRNSIKMHGSSKYHKPFNDGQEAIVFKETRAVKDYSAENRGQNTLSEFVINIDETEPQQYIDAANNLDRFTFEMTKATVSGSIDRPPTPAG